MYLSIHLFNNLAAKFCIYEVCSPVNLIYPYIYQPIYSSIYLFISLINPLMPSTLLNNPFCLSFSFTVLVFYSPNTFLVSLSSYIFFHFSSFYKSFSSSLSLHCPPSSSRFPSHSFLSSLSPYKFPFQLFSHPFYSLSIFPFPIFLTSKTFILTHHTLSSPFSPQFRPWT